MQTKRMREMRSVSTSNPQAWINSKIAQNNNRPRKGGKKFKLAK